MEDKIYVCYKTDQVRVEFFLNCILYLCVCVYFYGMSLYDMCTYLPEDMSDHWELQL